MPPIFMDLETIPGQQPWVKEEIEKTLGPPATYKKAESIAKWWATEGDKAADKAYRDTALDGAYGEIVCICAAAGDGSVRRFCSTDNETTRLDLFMEWLEDRPHLVTFTPFDIQFIWKRCKIHNIPIPKSWPHNATPWGGTWTDLQYEWYGKKITKGDNLAKLCRVLGIEVDDEIKGKDVWDAYQAGELDKIVDHCVADVERVRQIYKRIM